MPRIRPLLFLGLALALLVAACDGGNAETTRPADPATTTTFDPAAREELVPYFAAMNEIRTRIGERSQQVIADVGNDLLGEDPTTELTPVDAQRLFMERTGEIVAEGMDEVADLDPPAAARDLHRRFLEAGRDVAAAFADAAEEFGGEMTDEEIADASLRGDAVLNPAFDAFEESCLALQALAFQAAIEPGLNCG